MLSCNVKTMSESEFEAALVKWAECSEDLKNLLRVCRKLGIPTISCHASNNWGYVDLIIDEVSREYVSKMLKSIDNVFGMQVLFSTDGGNPFSGELWHKSPFSFSGNPSLFSELTSSVYSAPVINSPFEKMLDFYEILARKRVFLDVRMRHFRNYSYQVSFEFCEYSENVRTSYLTNFFEYLGFSKYSDFNKSSMEFNSASAEEFTAKLEEVEHALRNWFTPPTFFEKKNLLECCYKVLDGQGFDAVSKFIQEEFEKLSKENRSQE